MKALIFFFNDARSSFKKYTLLALRIKASPKSLFDSKILNSSSISQSCSLTFFSFSTKDKFYFYKILVTRLNGKVSKKENKVLLVEAQFPINFRKKEQVYFDVKERLSNLLNHNSKCNNLLMVKKSNKLKISIKTIKSRIADLSPNIEYLIKNLGLFEVSKPLFSGNVGFAYIICDTQNAENEENIKIKKNEMMNKHLLNLSNKILKRLVKQAQISQIQNIN